jgi:hydrogenase maturation protease
LTTLIICYGNDLMGNDAFGRAVYEALPHNVEKVFVHQLLPELLETVQKYERLIFVDAALGVGDIWIYEIAPSDTDSADFHHITCETFLKLLETLYNKTPIAYICDGYFDSFELGEKDVDFNEKVAKSLLLLKATLTKNTI